MPLTALAMPSRVRNSTCRSSTSSSGAGSPASCAGPGEGGVVAIVILSSASSALLWVEGVAQCVTHHDEREHGQPDEDRGEQYEVGVGEDATLCLGELQAPGDRGQLHTDAEEGQGGLGGDDQTDKHR